LEPGSPGQRVNLEKSLRVGDEIGGHIVSGHVDGVGEIVSITPEGDSLRFRIRAPRGLARFIAPKGSIAIDGTSLTVNEVDGADFRRQHHPAHGQGNDVGRDARGAGRQYRNRHAGALSRTAQGVRMSHSEFSSFISPPEAIIEDARNGRMFILVDAEDRENEGDVIIPAQMATPEAINFMAKHARGLVCLAITQERAQQLEPAHDEPGQRATEPDGLHRVDRGA
jgi:hypothetical protein